MGVTSEFVRPVFEVEPSAIVNCGNAKPIMKTSRAMVVCILVGVFMVLCVFVFFWMVVDPGLNPG